jgi:hypothetical protein
MHYTRNNYTIRITNISFKYIIKKFKYSTSTASAFTL